MVTEERRLFMLDYGTPLQDIQSSIVLTFRGVCVRVEACNNSKVLQN